MRPFNPEHDTPGWLDDPIGNLVSKLMGTKPIPGLPGPAMVQFPLKGNPNYIDASHIWAREAPEFVSSLNPLNMLKHLASQRATMGGGSIPPGRSGIPHNTTPVRATVPLQDRVPSWLQHPRLGYSLGNMPSPAGDILRERLGKGPAGKEELADMFGVLLFGSKLQP